MQKDEDYRVFLELFDNSDEYEGFEGFLTEDEDEENATQQQQQKDDGRKKWSTNDILCLMKCYYQSKPDERGYRKRMHSLWTENGRFNASEQQLCGQSRNVLKKGRLSLLQLEEVKRGLVADDDEDRGQGKNCKIEGGNLTIVENIEEEQNEADYGINTADTDDMNEEEKRIMSELKKVLELEELQKPVNLRKINRNRVREKTLLVNKVIQKYQTNHITWTNKLIRAGAIVVCNLLGVKEK